ncbi:hypothetical protein [Tenacibaculum sp. 190524A05c]|uniref:Uncharacterized protein n=1 Tax=Tenacibaculum platacis TaxID=3137852 RepID=A0ABM9NX05_9FLAO
MIKKIVLLVFINTIIPFKEIETNSNVTETKSKYYCNIQIGKDSSSGEFELRSSNGLRKGTIITTFNVMTDEGFYEKHPLNLGFSKVENSLDPKLKVGKYDLKTITLEGQDKLSFFSIGENIITEKTYNQAKSSGLLDDVQDSYVLLSEGSNEFKIDSVKDIGEVEDGTYYKTGKQEVKGSAKAVLLKISTNEKLTLSVQFNVEHEWSLSK